jgi:hypothetical protein
MELSEGRRRYQYVGQEERVLLHTMRYPGEVFELWEAQAAQVNAAFGEVLKPFGWTPTAKAEKSSASPGKRRRARGG